MIPKKEFFFLRHGQTIHNALDILTVEDENPPLTLLGQQQAREVGALVRSLNIDTVCHSPLQRTIDTMNLCLEPLVLPTLSLDNLRECNGPVWTEMTSKSIQQPFPTAVQQFFDQVTQGVSLALSCGESVLIVAHGGVHWALCHLLKIADHQWDLENCGLVHFSIGANGFWNATHLNKPLLARQQLHIH